MHQFIATHGVWVGIAGMWLFSALSGGMPDPTPQSGVAYRWIYGSLHILAANLDKVQKDLNQAQQKPQ